MPFGVPFPINLISKKKYFMVSKEVDFPLFINWLNISLVFFIKILLLAIIDHFGRVRFHDTRFSSLFLSILNTWSLNSLTLNSSLEPKLVIE
jgi:hypothetical protein